MYAIKETTILPSREENSKSLPRRDQVCQLRNDWSITITSSSTRAASSLNYKSRKRISNSSVVWINRSVGQSLYWKSPADDIFAEFDLSAIVRDYEKLQRKFKYPPRRVVPDNIDHEHDHFTEELKKLRYKNIKEWWLDNFPRCHRIIFRVLIPQLIAMAIAIGLGYLLAQFEIDEQYRWNYAASAKKKLQVGTPFLFGLPMLCFNHYLTSKAQSYSNVTITNDTMMQQSLSQWFGIEFPPVSPAFADDIQETIEEMKSYMEVYEDTASKFTTRLVEYTSVVIVNSALIFDWIRW